METSRVELVDLATNLVPDGVPYAAILPPGYERGGPYPLCIFLHGGGGSRQSLVDAKPLFDDCWATGVLPPMVVASPSAGAMSFYLDHPDGSVRWESFVISDFLAHLREVYNVGKDRGSTVISGVSMGGYGGLKIAFNEPRLFAAVAALQPMIEPALRADDAGPRNRFYYLGGGPDQLLGPERDATLFEANNPATRALRNGDAIRSSGLAIYVDTGDEDLLNAHDGAEFLHRVLWDLDISHEYRLVRGADHVGPSLGGRLREALIWLGAIVAAPDNGVSQESPEERAWMAWIQGGCEGQPPAPLDPTSQAFVRVLRAQLAPMRERAAQNDPTTLRRFGILPPNREAND